MTRSRYLAPPIMDTLDIRLQLLRRLCKFYSGCLDIEYSILAMASKLCMQSRSVVADNVRTIMSQINCNNTDFFNNDVTLARCNQALAKANCACKVDRAHAQVMAEPCKRWRANPGITLSNR